MTIGSVREPQGSSMSMEITFKGFIAGGIAGWIVSPWEGLKKTLESEQSGVAPKTKFMGVLKSIQQGNLTPFYPKNLWRGSASFSACVALASAISLTADPYLKSREGLNNGSLTSDLLVAAISGSFAAVLASTPSENMIRWQRDEQVGPMKAIKGMFAQDGVSRFFLGARALIVREMFFAAVMLGGAKKAQKTVYEKTGNEYLGKAAWCTTALAGAACSHPFDSIATCQQKNWPMSPGNAAKLLIKENGVSALFTGLSHRIVVFAGCAYFIPAVREILNGKQFSFKAE